MAPILDDKSTRRPVPADLHRYAAINHSIRASSAENDDDIRSTPEPLITPERENLAKAEIRHVSAIMRDLNSLRAGPERDDYGILRPTTRAYDEASRLLVDAAIVAAGKNRQIPQGCVSTDDEGGVRIEWVRADRSVHLAVPNTDAKSPYIYHELGVEYGTESATSERLAFWLNGIE